MGWMHQGVAALVLAGVMAGAPASAQPGHYIVVTEDAQGQLTPVHYAAVELDAARARGTPSVSAAQRGRAATQDAKALVTGTGWSQVVDAQPLIRGEFAANGVRGRISAHAVRPARRSFVLRVPRSAGNRLVVEHRGRRSVLDISQFADAARTYTAPARLLATPAAPSGNRLDVVVLGEGYTAAEQAKFQADVAAFTAQMFGTTPYKEYASYLNVVPLFVPSAQSGADHPPYRAGCTSTSCCAETAAQTDPRAGLFVSTAFDGTFCTAQIHRLVTVDDRKVYAAADAYPNWDALMVIVNDPVYGGSGGALSTFTTHSAAGLIAIHEFGHAFTGLADEYSTPYPGFPACSDSATSNTRCERNVTNLADAAQVKWREWFTPGNPIPTPAGTAGVGLFAGARYMPAGMYRAQHTCAMRELGVPFCAVCAESYVVQLYTAQAGVERQPIDLIEPGSEIPATSTPVAIVAGSSRTFSAAILRPAPDTVQLQWYLDGQPIAGATGASYSYRPTSATPATHSLRLLAYEVSPLVKPAERAQMQRSRTWSIRVRRNAHADVDGDGRSDLFWRNGGTGGNDVWKAASAASRRATSTVTDLRWQPAGLGDFNGDGRDDLFWRNTATGANDLWLSAWAATRMAVAAQADLDWTVVGVGDFDADGKADILWRNRGTGANALWPAARRDAARNLSAMADLRWQVAGVADFNGDGRDDILWRHSTSGNNELWRSGAAAQRQVLTAVTSMAWTVAGLGDFDRDAKADILWRNTGTGANVIWRGGSHASQLAVTALADTRWTVAAVGDFNGDGFDDVVWRHGGSGGLGGNELWRSAQSSQRVVLTPQSDLRWKIVP